MAEGKVCTKCNEYKMLYEYHKAKGRFLGVKSACKQCNKPKQQEHYQNNKEKYKQSYQKFIERNPNYQSNYRNKLIVKIYPIENETTKNQSL